MSIYSFEEYLNKKKEKQMVADIAELIPMLNSDGAIVILKRRINDWFYLHKKQLKKA